jgi:hypothetical protein
VDHIVTLSPYDVRERKADDVGERLVGEHNAEVAVMNGNQVGCGVDDPFPLLQLSCFAV